MTTVDHRNPSTHIVRKLKDPIYRTPQGKVVIAMVAACPKLRPFTGVLLQYLMHMDKSVKAEGVQALSRYKAYKATFLEVVATGHLPSRKYKHAMPLLRIACENRQDSFLLSCLHSVFRSYDLYLPNVVLQQKALDSFYVSFMTESEAQIDHTACVELQDEVFDFSVELTNLVRTSEFRKFISVVQFNRPFRPEEKAILLTKKGTARFKSDRQPAPIKGFAPAIVGSTAELITGINTRISADKSYNDLLQLLGNKIGERSFPSMKAVDRDPPEGYLEASLRRNVVIPSPGLKSRVIAVGDYNTQYMLSPIHRWAFECLSQITADYTFSHEKGFHKLSQFTEKGSYVACFDLSNATDAFPVSFTENVLRLVLPGGADIASLWTTIMTALPFGTRYYRRGQPMGLLSSWACFALSHHFVVWLAALKAGGNLLSRLLERPDEYYGIVGDDVFITHPALAHYYALIVVALGVKINFTKSLIVTSDKRVSEFVKRNSFCGREISAISPNLITKSFSDYPCLREFILRLRQLSDDSRRVPASFDEVTLRETMKSFSGGFIHHAISTLCTVPAVYAGLSRWEERAVWPPQARFSFLAMKALEILDLNLRGIYIGSNGQDIYNDLVNWLLTDITVEGSFHRTQFYEFMKKQNLLQEGLLSPESGMCNRLIAQLSDMATTLSERYLSEEEFSVFEESFLKDLESFVPQQTLSVKAVSRAMTRSYAFKIFRSIREFPTKQFEVLATLEAGIYALSQKYSFTLPSATSSSFSIFGEIERD